MAFLFVVLALLLPALLGGLWLNFFVPAQTQGRTALVSGNGLLLGLLVIPVLMRLLDTLGAPIGFASTGYIAAALLVVAGMVQVVCKRGKHIEPIPVAAPYRPSRLQSLLFAGLIILMVIRLSTLGLELLGRPLFPWDATMHWATKARVWYEFGTIVPFVENQQWLELGGDGVFTDHHPGYPITTPLLQVWMNSAAGQWDESLMNLPWLLCLTALGAAFYGQARTAGASPTLSMAFTYMLLSMPLLNTHVALAGYADLFLGACYCAAIMALYNWSATGTRWQGVLALIFAWSCLLIKNEGFYWLLTFIPAVVVVRLPGLKAAVLLLLLFLVLVAILTLFPRDLSVAGHSLERLNLHYRPEALVATGRNLWVHGNWHLFAYIPFGLIPLWIATGRPGGGAYLGISVALASALALFSILFLFTGYAYGAVHYTAVGRISVQLVPSLMFLALLMSKDVFSSSGKQDPRKLQDNPGMADTL